ncbi:5-oxoprolinase subunit PxpB [Paenibacillus cymbidii]|uniref:5-oxoprolinase subunit PxpB n=1 Tax=Paenibacillus cymbidii TaxID=1639034 RepID=UPI0010821DF8|nr:5-oxoprolinase subunit PxpB [Paenibacillus cymbidii]
MAKITPRDGEQACEREPAPELFPLGDTAVTIRFATAIGDAASRRVRALDAYLLSRPLPGMIEAVPAYAALTVFYDPPAVRAFAAAAAVAGLAAERGGGEYRRRTAADTIGALLLEAAAASMECGISAAGAVLREVEIPVCYGGAFGPDLAEVAAHCGLSADDVVRLHTEAAYTVDMIGFVPGFPYMSGLPPALAAPRRETPRAAVPAGAVGIGGAQTGVYPLATPGGWQLIGRTPLRLFRPEHNQPSLLAPGDRVRFAAIGEAAFAELARREEQAAHASTDRLAGGTAP